MLTYYFFYPEDGGDTFCETSAPTSLKTAFFVATAVKTSNQTQDLFQLKHKVQARDKEIKIIQSKAVTSDVKKGLRE
jgi:hypothetical protein